MNLGLFKRVKRRILAEPELFDMNHWSHRINECETAHCIAGHVVAECKSEVLHDGYAWTAARDLGITEREGFALFYTDEWPEDLRQKYLEADLDVHITCAGDPERLKKAYRKRARIACERIDYFIKNRA